MYTQTTCSRIIGFTFLLTALVIGTLGCEGLADSLPNISVTERPPHPVALYEVKYRIYEDLKRRSNGGIQDCPVIFKESDRRSASAPVALATGSGESRSQARSAWQAAQAREASRLAGGNASDAGDEAAASTAEPEEKPSIYDIEDNYVSIRITDLPEPDFYRIDLASPQAKTAQLLAFGEARITLKNGRTFERHPIEVTYFLAEDQNGWRCLHAHAVFDPDYKNPDDQDDTRPIGIGW